MEENNFSFLQIKHNERKKPNTYFRENKKEILPRNEIFIHPKIF